MKKFLVAIIAFLYIGSTTGATVDLHYCMGKLADWGLDHKKSTACGKCGMDKTIGKSSTCCKDEHVFLKNITDQKIAEAGLQVIQLFSIAIPVSFVEVHTHDFSSVTEENPIGHSPPIETTIPLYLRNCIFII